MNRITNSKLPVILAISLAFILIFIFVLSLTSDISYASEEINANNTEEFRIGQISDIHYFPYEYCYTETYRTDLETYEKTDFFGCMTGDTKIVLESGLTLISTIREIIKDAQNGTAPNVFVVTGDLCKNGERVALIDVANALRYMQNEVRKISGYEDFQLFVITGNHDLYNESAEVYKPTDGSGYDTDVVSMKEFALIFAGLGFPNANVVDSADEINLLDFINDESYWSSQFTKGYIYSKNSTKYDITYYSENLNQVSTAPTPEEKLNLYYNIGRSNGELSYFVKVKDTNYNIFMFDASDRESIDVSSAGIERLPYGEYEKYYKGNSTAFASRTFYLSNEEDGLTFIIREAKTMAEIDEAYELGHKVYMAEEVTHLCGGRIITSVLDWAENISNDINEDFEQTILSAFHMNIIQHWDGEAEILKDFVLYNWEYVAKRLLSMGVRYCYTGHQHASDVMIYTDAEGRTLYDMETGSMVSYDSLRRYTTITRYNQDTTFVGETFESNLYVLDNIKEIPDALVYNNEWNQSQYDIAMTAYSLNQTDENWENVIAANPEYTNYTLKYEDLSKYSFNEFINIDIYTRLVPRVVGHLINDNLIDSIKSMLSGLFNGDNTVLKLVTAIISAEDLTGLCNYLIDEIAYNLTDEYANGMIASKDYSVIAYVSDFIDELINIEFGDASIQSDVNPTNAGKLTLQQIASFIMTSHAGGLEVTLCETNAELQAEYTNIDNLGFTEVNYTLSPMTDLSGNEIKEVRFENPLDKTYRKRMTAALMDLHNSCKNGDFVEFLFYALFGALYETDSMDQTIANNSIYKSLPSNSFFKTMDQDKSILKILLEHKFDLSKTTTEIDPTTGNTYLTKDGYKSVEKLFSALPDLLPKVTKLLLGTEITAKISIDPKNLVLLNVINDVLPLIKSLLLDLIGFGLSGDTLYDCVDNAISGYITRSFEVGLGGIADSIVVGYATDVYPELSSMTDQSQTFLYEPFNMFKKGEHLTAKYNGTPINFTYLTNKKIVSKVNEELNPATQENGRVPSNLTSNFDNEKPTSDYTIKFYTAEDVYANFILYNENNSKILEVATSTTTANKKVDKKDVLVDPYITSTATKSSNGIEVTITTKTIPQYIPLIDLGILCITHAEIEDENEVSYTYQDRDKAEKNSVIYWNVTTVKVTGLKADTEYRYNVEGIYEGTSTLKFSLAEYNGVENFKMKTAKATSSKDKIEFLTIADIQGMIEEMYQDSYKSVDALLTDSRTKDFDFFLNAGDMCDNPKNFSQWQWATDTYIDLFANYSQFFTAGNHEGGTYAMTNFFDYSLATKNKKGDTYQNLDDKSSIEGGIFYSFNYGQLHVTVLNTNHADANGLSASQLTWLRNDLKNSTAKWKVVLMHKSLYSAGSHSYDSEVVAMRKQLVPIFAQNGVSMVFAGHDHTYTSTVLLDKNGNEVTDMINEDGSYATNAGTIYITLGTMGTKFYEYSENPITSAMFDEDNSISNTLSYQTFGKVIIDGDLLTYTGYRYDSNQNKIIELSTISLSKDDAKIIENAKSAIKLTSIDVIKTTQDLSNSDIIDINKLPAGYTLSFVSNGETYSNISDVTFKGKSCNVDVYIIDRNLNQVLLTSITINDSTYAASLGMKIGIPVGIVVVIIIVVVVIIVVKKKKQ